MKTIPKFTDLIAKAKDFIEEEHVTDEFIDPIKERQRYWFKNGWGASLVMFNDRYYQGSVEVGLLRGTEENYELAEEPKRVFDDKDLREALDEIEKMESAD